EPPERDQTPKVGGGTAQGGSGLRILAALACGSMLAGGVVPWGGITAAAAGAPAPTGEGTGNGAHVRPAPPGGVLLGARARAAAAAGAPPRGAWGREPPRASGRRWRRPRPCWCPATTAGSCSRRSSTT